MSAHAALGVLQRRGDRTSTTLTAAEARTAAVPSADPPQTIDRRYASC